MVGVAYLSADPNSPQYVKVGQHVKAGETLLLIEAMKTFNEIKLDGQEDMCIPIDISPQNTHVSKASVPIHTLYSLLFSSILYSSQIFLY